jgi:phage gpG-like protein
MSGVGIAFKLEISGLDTMLARVAATGRIEFQELLDGLSRQGMEQTRRRIEVEKTSPEGKAWPKTTDGRGALFVTGTHLARSIDHAVVGDAAVWGSGWIGARVHQFGAVIKPVNARALKFSIGRQTLYRKKVTIPARPYLGVSVANARALEATAVRFIGSYLQ